MKKNCLFLYLVCCFLTLRLTTNASTIQNYSKFTEAEAILKLVNLHHGFSLQPNKANITKGITGGPTHISPSGKITPPTSTIKLYTEVKKIADDEYQISLIKDWNLVVGGHKIIAIWKYKVTPNRIALLSKQDNQYLVDTMK